MIRVRISFGLVCPMAGWFVCRLSSVVFVQFLFVFDLVSLRFVVNLFINDF